MRPDSLQLWQSGCFDNCAALMLCHAAVLYAALLSSLAALSFGFPPWASQKAEPCKRGALQRRASQALFFGSAGNLFALSKGFP